MNTPKINPLHLFLTLLITVVSAIAVVIVLIVADSIFSDPLSATQVKFLSKLITIETAVFIIAVVILRIKRKKVIEKAPAKALSYTITTYVSVLVFLVFVYQPVFGLIHAGAADSKTPLELAKADEAMIEKLFRENTMKDSVTNEQINKLADTLGDGWIKTDSLLSTASADQKKVPVSVNIISSKTVFEADEPIILYITVTNNSNTIQKVLFDKPGLITDPLWETTVSVTDDKTKKSVLKYANRAVIISQAYSEDQLKDNYYFIKPGQSISRKRELSMLVIYNTPDNQLPKGDYTIQLFYYENFSNTLTIKVK